MGRTSAWPTGTTSSRRASRRTTIAAEAPTCSVRSKRERRRKPRRTMRTDAPRPQIWKTPRGLTVERRRIDQPRRACTRLTAASQSGPWRTLSAETQPGMSVPPQPNPHRAIPYRRCIRLRIVNGRNAGGPRANAGEPPQCQRQSCPANSRWSRHSGSSPSGESRHRYDGSLRYPLFDPNEGIRR